MKGLAAEGEYQAGIVLAAAAKSLVAVITCDGVLFSSKKASRMSSGNSISIIGDEQPVFNRFFLYLPFFACQIT